MITFKNTGDFSKSYKFFQRLLEITGSSNFDRYGKLGVEALKRATPKDTGKTANSWDYIIEHNKNSTIISWTNSNINLDCNIAIVLQYGHATENGYFIQGIDYINPAMRPVFEEIANDAWKEIIKE